MVIEANIENASIVNITSVSPKVGNPYQVNYNVSKGCVDDLTIAIASEMSMINIRCNAVRPGFIDTPLMADVSQRFVDLCLKNIMINRIAQPSEVSKAIVYLLSPMSSYITGCIIEISGGYEI